MEMRYRDARFVFEPTHTFHAVVGLLACLCAAATLVLLTLLGESCLARCEGFNAFFPLGGCL
jgi:hypothetical protein